MSNRTGSRLARWLALSMLMMAAGAGCKANQYGTRVFRQDHNSVVIASPPDNSTRSRSKADRMARKAIGDCIFANFEDVETGDVIKTTSHNHGRIRDTDKGVEQAAHRHEYRYTYKAKRTASD